MNASRYYAADKDNYEKMTELAVQTAALAVKGENLMIWRNWWRR